MNRRVITAFALTPALIPAFVFAWTIIERKLALEEIAAVVAVYASVTYGTAILLGIPTFILFEKRGWRRSWHYALGGAAIGLASFLLLSAYLRSPAWDFRMSVAFVVPGLGCAMFFWLMAIWRHPHRSSHETVA